VARAVPDRVGVALPEAAPARSDSAIAVALMLRRSSAIEALELRGTGVGEGAARVGAAEAGALAAIGATCCTATGGPAENAGADGACSRGPTTVGDEARVGTTVAVAVLGFVLEMTSWRAAAELAEGATGSGERALNTPLTPSTPAPTRTAARTAAGTVNRRHSGAGLASVTRHARGLEGERQDGWRTGTSER